MEHVIGQEHALAGGAPIKTGGWLKLRKHEEELTEVTVPLRSLRETEQIEAPTPDGDIVDTGAKGKSFEAAFVQGLHSLGLSFRENKAAGAVWDIEPQGAGWNKIIQDRPTNLKVYSTRWLFSDAATYKAAKKAHGMVKRGTLTPEQADKRVENALRKAMRQKGVTTTAFTKPKNAKVQANIIQAATAGDEAKFRELLVAKNFATKKLSRSFTVEINIKWKSEDWERTSIIRFTSQGKKKWGASGRIRTVSGATAFFFRDRSATPAKPHHKARVTEGFHGLLEATSVTMPDASLQSGMAMRDQFGATWYIEEIGRYRDMKRHDSRPFLKVPPETVVALATSGDGTETELLVVRRVKQSGTNKWRLFVEGKFDERVMHVPVMTKQEIVRYVNDAVSSVGYARLEDMEYAEMLINKSRIQPSEKKKLRVFLRDVYRSTTESIGEGELDEGLALHVRRKPGRSHGHPEAQQHGNEVWIYPKFDALPGVGAKRHVLFHEVGHWFRQEFVSLSDIMGWEPGDKFYGVYGYDNSEEGFAEAFATFFTDPSHLKREWPGPAELIRGYVRGKERQIVSWVDSAVAQLTESDTSAIAESHEHHGCCGDGDDLVTHMRRIREGSVDGGPGFLAIFLTPQAKAKLARVIPPKFRLKSGDHVTIKHAPSEEDIERFSRMVGKRVTLTATHLIETDDYQAVRVKGVKAERGSPHITISWKEGSSPAKGNQAMRDHKGEPIQPWLKLEGVYDVFPRSLLENLTERADRVRIPRPFSVELPPDKSITPRWATGTNTNKQKPATRAYSRDHTLLWLPIDKVFKATESWQRLSLDNRSTKRGWIARWWWSQGHHMDPSFAGIADASGQLIFTDGRHRLITAWQLGERRGPIFVPNEDVTQVKALVSGARHENFIRTKPLPEAVMDLRLLREGYYGGDQGLADVVRRWQEDGDKLLDTAQPLMVPLRVLWPHREFTWDRADARLEPQEWDALKKSMRSTGWRRDEPAWVSIGRRGGVKVGEGNHRLALAREVGIRMVPVRFQFLSGKVVKDSRRPEEPIIKAPKPSRSAPSGPTSPESDRQIDNILGLLGL